MAHPLRSLVLGSAVVVLTVGSAAADWRELYPELEMGVITGENEADRLARYAPVVAYFEEALGVPVQIRNATDYAGVIEALNSETIQIARLGPASYAQAWIVMDGEVMPLVGEVAPDGTFGYHSVIVVPADSPFQSIEDLEGHSLAFADPNSTSGFQAPSYFLREDGIVADEYFSETGFSGSHENSVIAILDGTYDAAATWWRDETRSNFARMAEKGMIPEGAVRVIWQSPKLPASPWAVRTDLPEDLQADIRSALLDMESADPEAWEGLTDGESGGYIEVEHEIYEPIVRMIQFNQRERRGG